MKNGNLITALMGFIIVLLTAWIGISTTFLWRAEDKGDIISDRLYNIQTEQTVQTTILKQQSTILQDHEDRLRTVEARDAVN